jgi:hypothetical protein
MDWLSSANRALLCGLGPPRRAFGSNPAGSVAWVGLRWCGGWRRAKPYECLMTRTKSKRKTATRSRPIKTTKRKSSKPPVLVDASSGALAKTRAGTKNARVVAMLLNRTN